MSLPNPNDITAYPPIWPSAKFNTNLFQGNNYITRQQADLLYASVYSIRNIKYINDVTEGIVSPQKAIITDSSNNITGINNLTLNGASSTLSLSGASSIISISNNTASTSSITGAIQCAGGAYFGNHCLYNGNITLQGLSAILSLSGASSIISLSNTSGSTSSCTGAIRCSGGIYTGADCLFNTNLQVNGIVKLTYNEASTSASTGTLRLTGGIYVGQSSIMAANLTLNGTSSTLNLTGISSVISISNTSASTSSITGALRVAGGAYFGANSLFAGNVCVGGSTDTSRLISALNSSLANGSSNSICFGKANSAGNQAEFTYTVEATATNNKLSIGFHSNNTLITMFNRTTGGQLMYLCNSPLAPTGANVNILTSLAFTDNSSNYARFLYVSNNLQIDFIDSSGLQQSTYMMENDSLSLGPGLLVPQFRLDLGSKGAITGNNDFLVSLFNTNNTSPTTGFGFTSGDNLFISSGGSNGIIFRNTHGLSGVGANINRGTRTHQMYKSGHFEATSGIRAGEYSYPPYTGKGVEMHWSTSSNIGDVFAYDRTNGNYLTLRFNNILTASASGRIGISRTSPLYKLDVAGATRSDNYFLTTDSAVYGRLLMNYAGSEYLAIGPYDGNNYRMAFRASDGNGIFSATYLATYAASFNIVSDYRSKENIEDLTYGLNKILQLKPKIYKLKGHFNDKNLGFIAHEIQEILPEVVEGYKDALDEMGNIKYQSVNTIELIPILVKAIQEQNKHIINNQKLIESLQNQLKEMQSDDETIYDMIEDIYNFLNITTE